MFGYMTELDHVEEKASLTIEIEGQYIALGVVITHKFPLRSRFGIIAL